MFDALAQDARYAIRQLRRTPGFALAVIAMLAVTIGATTALYSLLHAIVLRPVPVAEPQRLVVLSVTDERGQGSRFIYESTFRGINAQQRVFDAMSLYSGGGVLTIEARGVIAQAVVEGGTPDYHGVLGVRPFLGRFISIADAPLGAEAAAVVVIGHRFWQRQFAGDPHAIGETLKVSGMPLTIIGVTPADFSGLQVDAGADFFVPMAVLRRLAGDPRRPIRANSVIARLRSGVTFERARAEIVGMWPAIQGATMPAGLAPGEQEDFRAQRVTFESIATGFSPLRRQYGTPLVVLMWLSSAMLLIGCVNLSGLFLARASGRHHQLAICVALGATRARLVRQLLVETACVSLIGTAAALPLAWWASRALTDVLWGSRVPLAKSTTPDLPVLGVIAAVSVAVGLIMGVLPAWTTGRSRGEVALHPSRSVTSSTGRWGKVLLVVQMALSLVLVVGAGLFVRTLTNLRTLDLGFRGEQIHFTRLFAIPGGYRNQDDASYYPDLVDRISKVPGVAAVSLSHFFPAYFNFPVPLESMARAESADRATEARGVIETVSPGFFQTVGITLLQGRDFTWHDAPGAGDVAIVTAMLARHLFPSGNAVGQRIRIGADPKRRAIEIVGIVTDATVVNLRRPQAPVAFRPTLQEPSFAKAPDLNVRITGDPKAVEAAVRQTVGALGHEYVRTLVSIDQEVDRALLQERLMAALSSFFAGLAALLAFVGLYGSLAYGVARRTREIGVRMALGATRSNVIGLVARESLTLTIAGVLLGIPCALAAGRVTTTLLYDLSPADPGTLVAAAVFFVGLGAAASLVPAVRASRTTPDVALRYE